MARIEEITPNWWTDTRRRLEIAPRLLSFPLRALPDFLVIGAQKGGTTSLYATLDQHPQVISAFKKEVHFFDIHYGRGQAWYRAHFPRSSVLARRGCISGEASPYYLFHPRVPERVHRDLPQVKLIALLRHPVDRAFSHYQHLRRQGREELSFEAAIEAEARRTEDETQRLRSTANHYSEAHRLYSYLARGRYLEQLQAWRAHFPSTQLLVLRSEDYYEQPEETLPVVLDFLGLDPWRPSEFRKVNAGAYSGLSSATRARLLDYFRPHNEALEEDLGRDMAWRS